VENHSLAFQHKISFIYRLPAGNFSHRADIGVPFLTTTPAKTNMEPENHLSEMIFQTPIFGFRPAFQTEAQQWPR